MQEGKLCLSVFQDNLKSPWFPNSGSLSIAMLNSDQFRGSLPPSTSPRRLDTVALRRGEYLLLGV